MTDETPLLSPEFSCDERFWEQYVGPIVHDPVTAIVAFFSMYCICFGVRMPISSESSFALINPSAAIGSQAGR